MFYADEMSGLDRQLFESGETGDGLYAEEDGDSDGLNLIRELVEDGIFVSVEELEEVGEW